MRFDGSAVCLLSQHGNDNCFHDFSGKTKLNSVQFLSLGVSQHFELSASGEC